MRAQRSGRGLLSVAAKPTSFVEHWRELAEINKRVGASRLIALTSSVQAGRGLPDGRPLASRARPESGWLVR